MLVARIVTIIVLSVMGTVPALAQAQPTFAQVTADSSPVADAYFDAYTRLDWDRLEPLVADGASFQDRTAELVFGSVGATGKPAMMKLFREGYAGITKIIFKPMRRIHTGHYGIFEGDLNWATKMPDGRIVESTTPFLVTIRVENGKVIEHRDYADYAPFLAAVLQARKDGK
ncbi:nuclear transport factor 2 family protein [Niveispirillum cyanobacteriorum]|uniref:Uncharacterized protein n=1 Tax=Niveispirillum cyanobacteriorum TaxID=1612173 RepID=A0A2K9NFP2_9PROT|nr:nuclear transport factor 2 family protein [Niveispirillum cyanobacteriorum]AUN31055.1 hypothetical protein C0V82_13020 [Niveispirillum cyanobacteriorum]GGE84107.1 hypothetical protein GCM10011317_46610 [Niveispirillum cyanobacteriorum]